MTDSASVTFRTAAPVVETPSTDTPSPAKTETQQRVSDKDSDITPYVHQALTKKPYAVKFLDLDMYFDDPDFEDVREQAAALDEYVITQAKARGLNDSDGSYKEVIDALYKQIGKSANEDPTKALKRLSTAAGAIKRLEEAKLQPVLSAKSMTPTEFEEVQP